MQGRRKGGPRGQLGVDWTSSVSHSPRAERESWRTLWEETGVSVLEVAAQEPAVAKVVIALDELDAVAALEAQFVRAARGEFVCDPAGISRRTLRACRRLTDHQEGVARPRLVHVGARGHV